MAEPTVALGSPTEPSIFEMLSDEIRGKTLFIVAHRLSTIKNADRIIVLSEKHLSGFGSHDELIKKNDYYCSLLKSTGK
jgi:ATP-binding cassette subfamily B protein